MVTRSLLAAVYGPALLQVVLAGDTTNTALISSPTAQPTNLRSLKYAGCYKSAAPMINHGPYTYQSSGNCQKICYLLGNLAMALGNGTDCWCGDMLPATTNQVDDSQCSTTCAGYDKEKCGGANVFTVYQTGYTLNDVAHADAAQVADGASSSSTSSSSASTTTTAKSKSSGGGGSSVGIAVGVVVGILVLAALAGAAFLYFRRRQQHQMEEYKKQVDAPPFFNGNNASTVPETRPSMWAPDNRLDGAGGNRNSVGSIADNQDYSRKILQVRNPDGF